MAFGSDVINVSSAIWAAAFVYGKRHGILIGWEALSNNIGRNALSPDPEGSMETEDEDGQSHGPQYHRHIRLLERT